MAKELARKIGYVYIDSGAMYRAVTLYCIDNDLFENDTVNESELQKVINTLQITFKINPESGKSSKRHSFCTRSNGSTTTSTGKTKGSRNGRPGYRNDRFS